MNKKRPPNSRKSQCCGVIKGANASLNFNRAPQKEPVLPGGTRKVGMIFEMEVIK